MHLLMIQMVVIVMIVQEQVCKHLFLFLENHVCLYESGLNLVVTCNQDCVWARIIKCILFFVFRLYCEMSWVSIGSVNIHVPTITITVCTNLPLTTGFLLLMCGVGYDFVFQLPCRQ